MKRSISLSELRESLVPEDDYGTLTVSGSMRRARSAENLTALSSRSSGSSTPTTAAGGAHGARAPMLSEKELRDHFNMPLNEVAKKFGMCTTALKKLCRKYGVMQWPHRKLRSLEKKIASLKAEQRYTTDGQGHLDEEIRKLELHREALITGSGDAGPDDGMGGPWSPNAMSPGGSEASLVEGGDSFGGLGGYSLSGGLQSMGKVSSSDDLTRDSVPEGRSRGGDEAGGRGQLQQHVKHLEEENASLRALSRSLMKERQKLQGKQSAMDTELEQLRKLVHSLQGQLSLARQGQLHLQQQQQQQHQAHHHHAQPHQSQHAHMQPGGGGGGGQHAPSGGGQHMHMQQQQQQQQQAQMLQMQGGGGGGGGGHGQYMQQSQHMPVGMMGWSPSSDGEGSMRSPALRPNHSAHGVGGGGGGGGGVGGGGGWHSSPSVGPLGVGMQPGPLAGGGGGGGGGGQDGDFNTLSWMAPDFDVDDMLNRL